MAHRLSHDSGEYIDPAGREYKVLEKIQSGGMGTVYRVRKESTGNMFAAKECDLLDDLKGRGLSRQDALEIFRREGRYLEQLNFDVIPRGFFAGFSAKRLAGLSEMRERRRSRRTPLARSAKSIRAICITIPSKSRLEPIYSWTSSMGRTLTKGPLPCLTRWIGRRSWKSSDG